MRITADTMTSEASEHTATYHHLADGWTVTYLGGDRFVPRDHAVSAMLLAEAVATADNPDELLDDPQIIDWAEHIGLPVEDAVNAALQPPPAPRDPAAVTAALKAARDSGLAWGAIAAKAQERAARWASLIRAASDAGATADELQAVLDDGALRAGVTEDELPSVVRALYGG